MVPKVGYNDRVVVQRGTTSIGLSVTTINETISAVNDLEKAHLEFSWYVDGSANASRQDLIWGRLTSTTNIEFKRGYAAGDGDVLYIAWEVIERVVTDYSESS